MPPGRFICAFQPENVIFAARSTHMMPNPYTDIFDDNDRQESKKPAVPADGLFDVQPPAPEDLVEPLDRILQKIDAFRLKGEAFSVFLSKTRAIDHRDEAHTANSLLSLFLVSDDSHEKSSLAAEKAHYNLLQQKFRNIMDQMKELAQLHLDIVRHFNNDIGKQYYSIEKTDFQVKKEIEFVVDQITMQRRILGEATRDLNILEDALQATEHRLKNWIDAGSINNLSAAEFHLLQQNRAELTSGKIHQFDYSFFDLNAIDKLALRLGIYLKETTAQYFNGLSVAMGG